MSILFTIVWLMFIFYDIGYYFKFNEGRGPDGWKKYAIAVLPGSGFYYKWLAEKEKT